MLRFAPGSGAERFSTRTRKTFNISTEFYTEYSGFSTAFVENPVESVKNRCFTGKVFHREKYSRQSGITFC